MDRVFQPIKQLPIALMWGFESHVHKDNALLYGFAVYKWFLGLIRVPALELTQWATGTL